MKKVSTKFFWGVVFTATSSIVFALDAIHAPFILPANETAVMVVGKVEKLSSSEFKGHWDAPQAIATVQIKEVIYGEEIGKKLLVLTDDIKKKWFPPPGAITNVVNEGQAYLFCLVKFKNAQGGYYIPVNDGIRDPHHGVLESARRYANELKNGKGG